MRLGFLLLSPALWRGRHLPASTQMVVTRKRKDASLPAAVKVKAKKEGKSEPTVVNGYEDKTGPSYFLFKSEGESRIVNGEDMRFSIDDLENQPDAMSCWDGVRNYQARNVMKEMQKGDLGFFYHSNCSPPGIVGVVEVVREAYPDHTQFDKNDVHYDPKSTEENPRWFMVDVQLKRHTKRMISLDELKMFRDGELKDMMLLNNSRLSVQRIQAAEWSFILSLEDTEAPVTAKKKKLPKK